MKRLLLALICALAVVTPSAYAVDLSFLQSVQPIAIPVPDANGIGFLREGCTASSIGPGEWLTAAHCVAGYTKFRYYIMGDEAHVTKYDAAKDLAKLRTYRASAPALKIALRSPEVLDPVLVPGFPLGWKNIEVAMGHVSGFQMHYIEEAYWPMMMINVTGAPGNSGSPVLNADHEIIGVVQVGWMPDTFSPKMGSVTHSVLREFLQ